MLTSTVGEQTCLEVPERLSEISPPDPPVQSRSLAARQCLLPLLEHRVQRGLSPATQIPVTSRRRVSTHPQTLSASRLGKLFTNMFRPCFRTVRHQISDVYCFPSEIKSKMTMLASVDVYLNTLSIISPNEFTTTCLSWLHCLHKSVIKI